MRRARAGTGAAAIAAGAGVAGAAAWQWVPAASWLPGVRAVLSPSLDGRGDPGHVALTFDDGPDLRSTPCFLRELDRLRVRATFFVLGAEVERHTNVVRRIASEGHEVAVHGWHHERPRLPRPWKDEADLARAVAAVRAAARAAGGGSPRWYRPPYGILTGGRLRAARRLGLRPVLWTSWGRDWTEGADRDSVLAELSKRFGGGATVLLHDSDRTSAPGAWHASLDALPHLVARCRAAGLTVGPLEEHGVQAAADGWPMSRVGNGR